MTDEQRIDELVTAYSDGTFTDAFTEADVRSIAYEIARRLVEANHPEAGIWFRRATECPEWECLHEESSWVLAAGNYALWAHERGEEALCAAWSFRIVEHAANEGPGDRGAMDADSHKPYRYSYGLASRAEWSRVRVMRHLLAEHNLPIDQRVDIALLLSDTYRFGTEEDHAVIAESLRDVYLGGLAPSQHPDPSPFAGTQAWALTHWVLADGVPAAFRFAGLPEQAEGFAALVPSDLSACSDWYQLTRELMDEFTGWDVFDPRDLHDVQTWFVDPPQFHWNHPWSHDLVKDVLSASALTSKRSRFRTERLDSREDGIYSDGSGRWRLLRGDASFLGLYLATGGHENWVRLWDLAGFALVRAIYGALTTVAAQENADFSRPIWDDVNIPPKERWQVLVDAFVLARREFDDAAAAL